MCIRDRYVALGREQEETPNISAEYPATARMARRLKGKRGAVSYTHLRAHETVLDLVCRLLLEKTYDQDVMIPSVYHNVMDNRHLANRRWDT